MHRQAIKKICPWNPYLGEVINGIEQYSPYIKIWMEQEPEICIKKLWEELKEKEHSKSYSAFCESLIYYDIRLGKKVKHIKPPKHIILFFKPSKMVILFMTTEEKPTFD